MHQTTSCKRFWTTGALSAISLAVIGCAAPGGGVEIVAVESNDLGITHVEIDHRTEGPDRLLVVRGLDDGEQEKAIATLRTGMVFYSADPDLIPAQWHPGTELIVTAGDETTPFTSPDREPHHVNAPRQPELAGFVEIGAVASAIDHEAGIQFTRTEGNGEVALSAGTCTGSRFPTTVGNPKQCCEDGNTTYHKIGTGSLNEDKLGWRTYNSNACRTSSGATGCTTDCYYGPCGSHNETVTASVNTTNAKVFIPTSAPTTCGYDSNGATAGGFASTELYASQTVYGGVAATCMATDCLADGSPGVVLTVIVDTTDTHDSATVNVDYTGTSCTAQAHSIQTCTFIVPIDSYPTVTNAFSPGLVGFTGACNSQGNDCTISLMGSAKTVTATYYCPDGWTCGL